MNRMTLYGHGGFADYLGEGGMRMDGHPELLRRSLNELGEDALGDQVRHVRPYGVHPQDEVGLGVGHHLEEPVRLALDERLAYGPEGELGLLDLVPRGVREPVAPDHVPRGVDAFLGRPPELVYLDDAPVVYLDLCRVEVELLRHGLAPDGYEQRLCLDCVATPGLSRGGVLTAVGAALALGLLLLSRLGPGNFDLHAAVCLLQALRVGLGAR